MDEAAISYTVKTRAGDLFTVRGDSASELRRNIAEVIGDPSTEKAMSALYELAGQVPGQVEKGAQVVSQALAPVPEPPSSYEPPWNDAPPASALINTQTLPASMAPQCGDCGAPMRFEEWTGKNGKNAGRTFKAWKCVRDKDHKPQWVN